MRNGRSRSCPKAESLGTGLRSSVTLTSSSPRSSTNLCRLVTVKKTVTSSTRLRMVQGSGAEEEGVKLKLDDLKPLPLGVTGTPELRHPRSEEHTSELQSLTNLVCRLLLEKKKNK